MSEALHAAWAVAPWWVELWAVLTIPAAFIGCIAVGITGDEGYPWVGVLILAATPMWPLMLVGLILASPDMPWTEEGRLARQIRRVERRQKLLAKERELEAAEASYLAALEGEP